MLKRLFVLHDESNAFMALGDMTNRKALLGSSTLTAFAGLLLVLTSTNKNS